MAVRSGNLNSDNLIKPEQTLKIREAFKYELMLKLLNEHKIDHEFEYRLGEYIFDLAIFDSEILVEFDESYHSWSVQKESDSIKQKFAESKGFTVIRIETENSSVIPAKVLNEIIELVLSERKVAQRIRDKAKANASIIPVITVEPFIECW